MGIKASSQDAGLVSEICLLTFLWSLARMLDSQLRNAPSTAVLEGAWPQSKDVLLGRRRGTARQAHGGFLAIPANGPRPRPVEPAAQGKPACGPELERNRAHPVLPRSVEHLCRNPTLSTSICLTVASCVVVTNNKRNPWENGRG